MKKCLLLLLLIISNNIFAQEIIIKPNSIYGEITSVKESGDFVSVIDYDKKVNVNTATLYNNEGKEVLKINDKKLRYIKFAEYIPSKNIYLVIFEGWEGSQDEPMEWDKIRAFDIKTGNKLWEANSSALDFKVSPNGNFLSTISSTDELAERDFEFEVFNLDNGAKIISEPKSEPIKIAWYDENRILVAFNETEKRKPQYLLDLQEYWRANQLKEGSQKYADYKNNKISKIEYDKYDDEATKEKHKKLNEFASKIYKETKIITTCRVKLVNVNTKQDEYNIVINKEDNGNFLLNLVNGNQPAINVDKDKNIYVLGYLADGKIEKTIHQFIKYDKNLNMVWKSQLLPLTVFTNYLLDQKPYFGFVVNNKESFIEPLRGSLVAFEEVQKKFNSIPTISSIRRKFASYVPMKNFRMEIMNDNVILKAMKVK